MKDIFLLGGPLDEKRFDLNCRMMLHASVRAANQTRWETLRSPHLFMGMMAEPDEMIAKWCDSLETNPNKLLAQFGRLFLQSTDDMFRVRLHREFCSTNTLEILRAAARRAHQLSVPMITSRELFWSLLEDEGCVAACFRESGYSASLLRVMLKATESDQTSTKGSQSI